MPLFRFTRLTLPAAGLVLLGTAAAAEREQLFAKKLNVNVPHISTDKSVKLRLRHRLRPRAAGPATRSTSGSTPTSPQPVTMEPGADLMLLHPDGKRGAARRGRRRLGHRPDGLVRRRVGLLRAHLQPAEGAASGTRRGRGRTSSRSTCQTRKIVRLTNQKFTPNTGAAELVEATTARRRRARSHFEYGVFNMGPCPLPGGRIVFTSNRDGFRPGQGLPGRSPCNCS